jgi:hypothetical protein
VKLPTITRDGGHAPTVTVAQRRRSLNRFIGWAYHITIPASNSRTASQLFLGRKHEIFHRVGEQIHQTYVFGHGREFKLILYQLWSIHYLAFVPDSSSRQA